MFIYAQIWFLPTNIFVMSNNPHLFYSSFQLNKHVLRKKIIFIHETCKKMCLTEETKISKLL